LPNVLNTDVKTTIELPSIDKPLKATNPASATPTTFNILLSPPSLFINVSVLVIPSFLSQLINFSKTGTTISGQVKTELEKILKKYNSQFTIQDNTLHVLPSVSQGNSGVVNIEAVRLSPSTGLLKFPVIKKEKDANGAFVNIYEFQSLIIASKICPAYAVLVQTNSGDYLPLKLVKVIYSGDTHGNDWICNCSGVEI